MAFVYLFIHIYVISELNSDAGSKQTFHLVLYVCIHVNNVYVIQEHESMLTVLRIKPCILIMCFFPFQHLYLIYVYFILLYPRKELTFS